MVAGVEKIHDSGRVFWSTQTPFRLGTSIWFEA